MRAPIPPSSSVHYVVGVHTTGHADYKPYLIGHGRVPRIYHPLSTFCHRFMGYDYHGAWLRRQYNLAASDPLLLGDGPWNSDIVGQVRLGSGPLVSSKIRWIHDVINSVRI